MPRRWQGICRVCFTDCLSRSIKDLGDGVFRHGLCEETEEDSGHRRSSDQAANFPEALHAISKCCNGHSNC